MLKIANHILVKQKQIDPLAHELLNCQCRRHDLQGDMDVGMVDPEIKQRLMTDGIKNDRPAYDAELDRVRRNRCDHIL